MFGQVPTAQKCCKKQYELKVSVFNDSKKHSCNECKPHADQDMKVAKNKMKQYKETLFRHVLTAQDYFKNIAKSRFSV